MPTPLEIVTGIGKEALEQIMDHGTEAVTEVLELVPPPLRLYILATVINRMSDVPAFYQAIGDVLAMQRNNDDKDDEYARNGAS